MRSLVIILFFLPHVLRAQSDSITIQAPYYEVITTDDTGGMANYIRYEYYPDSYFVIRSAKDSSTISIKRPSIPAQFKHWIQIDSTMKYVRKEEQGDPVKLPDSLLVMDMAAADSFFLSRKIHFDTVWISDATVLQNSNPFNNQFSSVCGYYYNTKNGWETNYYSIAEIKRQVITGPNLRLKSKGYWKVGNRHGKWFYYSPNGELDRVEKWRNGKLIRTRYAH